jgi:hypothetical protein
MYFSTLLFSIFTASALAQYGAASSSSAPTTVTSQCTQTVTAHQAFGCTITNAGHIATESIDCKGCIISTTTVANGFFGHGPVCFNGRKTMTDTKITATVQACAAVTAS